MKTQGYIKLIHSADTNKDSVLELNILPGEKTPWHYHTLFSEIFAVLTHIASIRKKTPYFVDFQNFQIPEGGLRIFPCEGLGFIFQGRINLLYFLCGLAALADNNVLPIIIFHGSGYYFPGVHDSYNIKPLIIDPLLFELVPDGIDYPIGQ